MRHHRLLQPIAFLIMFEGLACASLLISLPSASAKALALGLSPARLVLLSTIIAGTFAAAWLGFAIRRGGTESMWAVGIRLLSSRSSFVVAVLISASSLLLVLHRNIAPAAYIEEIARLFPFALFVFLVSGHFLLLAWIVGDKAWKERLLLVTLLLILVVFYWDAAHYFSSLNSDWNTSDQGAFIEFALEVKESGYTFTGRRNFMPLYAYLLAPWMDVGVAPFENFAMAKSSNIALSMLLLVAIYFIVRRWLTNGQTLLFTLVVAFSLFIYKAPYSQPELLFYFIFFGAFILSCQLILHPNWKTASLLGLSLATAHLTKASALPMTGLLLSTLVILVVASALNHRQQVKFSLRRPRAYLLSLALVALFFLTAMWPYISESRARYGQYFYNVNTTFYTWYDSWQEAIRGTRAHGDGEGWPDMPEDEIPSFQRYLSTHSPAEIGARVWRGVKGQAANLWNTFNIVSYPLLFFSLLTTARILAPEQARALWQTYWPLILFVVLLWGGYLLAFAWYAPIAEYADQRFTYSLMLPMLFASLVALQRILDSDQTIRLFGHVATARVWHHRALGMVALILALDVLVWAPIHLSRFGWYGK